MNKSSAAFLISADRLFADNEKIYFWTITWRETLSDWQYPTLFNKFMREVRNKTKLDFKGLRVIEPHKSHGLHYHMLLDTRIPIDIIRSVGGKYGIGRVHVCVAREQSKLYLAKYMLKSKPEKIFGPRRWWRVGTWKHTRKNDIQVESVAHTNIRELFWKTKVPFNWVQEVMVFSRLWGHWRDWPSNQVQKNAFIEKVLECNGVAF